MKYYNKAHHKIFSKQLGMAVKRAEADETDVLRFTPLVLKFTRQVGLEDQKVGVLNLQDIQQAAFEGLVEMWHNVDWDKIKNSNQAGKVLVNYLSSRIQRVMKRQIYYDATGVRIPEYLITKTKKEQAMDRLFGNWLYSFKLDDYSPGTMIRYIDTIDYDANRSSSYENDLINEKLSDMMLKHLNDKERDVIRWNFGLDADKLTENEIAERLNKSRRGVQEIKKRALKKLNNEECYELLKNFL